MKKNLMRLLAMLMALAMLTACGSTASSTAASTADSAAETEEAAPAEETEEAEEAAPAEEAEEAEEAAPVEDAASAEEAAPVEEAEPEWEYTPISYPICEDETLSYWIIWELSDDTVYDDINDHIVIQILKEATGVTLDIQAQTQAAGQTNTDLMIASGDYPDLIGNLDYSTGMEAAIEDEVVVDIKDYIADYSPDYYKYLIENDNAIWNNVQTESGYIGAYVVVGQAAEIDDGMMTFSYMLDELGFTQDDLKTIDKYEEYLTAAKNQYGLASPLYLPGDFMLDGDAICSAFDVSLKIDAITGDLPWTVQDGEVKFGYLEQGFTDYVTLMHEWYEAGLIDSDTASHPTEYKNEDQIGLIAGKQLAVFNRGKGLIDLFANISGEAVVPIYQPVQNEDDVLHVGGSAPEVTGESGLVITTGCEDLELAMEFCNYLYTDDFYLTANYGVDTDEYGIPASYHINDAGEPEFEEFTYMTQGRTFSSVMMDYQLFTQVDANVETPGQSEAALACPEIWGSNQDGAYDYPESCVMNTEEADQYNAKAGDIVTICQEYTTKFIVGDISLDEIPDFQQKLIDSGVQDCIDAKQACYDRTKG